MDHRPVSVSPIDPLFSFPFSSEDIRSSYDSLESAFEDGAYLLVAEYADPGSELEGSALVLGGILGRGLKILATLQSLTPRGLICKAFAEWMLGHDEAARATLTLVSQEAPYSEQARTFHALIGKEQITVFLTAAFLPVPSISSSATSASAPAHRYGRFLVKHVGTQLEKSAYEYELHQPFDRFIDDLPQSERPDFIFALTPAWIPPQGLENLAIPKILWCHDVDVFAYRSRENFALYDVRICLTSQEHFQLSRAVGKFCASNLMSDPLNTEFPKPQRNHKKDFDVIFTGSAFDFFHSEKARFIYQLAGLADEFRVAMVHGYLPREQYYDFLSRSKFLPIVSRIAGNPTPRWRDGLANSAYVLYPRGTAYGKAFPGCFPYDASSITADIRTHLEKYDSGDPAYDLSRTAGEIASEMAIFQEGREVLFERQLKYAAFLGLVMRPPASKTAPPILSRPVWLTPAIDPAIYGRQSIQTKIARLAASIRDEELTTAQTISDVAHLYAQLAVVFPEAPELPAWEARADHLFAEGCRRYPSSLALWFSRAQWTFFRDGGRTRSDAARMFWRLIDDWDGLQFDPHGPEIGFPYTLNERDKVFPYYDYAHLMTSFAAKTGRSDQRPGLSPAMLRDVVKGAAYGYMGLEAIEQRSFEEGFEYLNKSLRIFPDNLPILRFLLDSLLAHLEQRGQAVPDMECEICDAFIACANKYPAILLTYTHRVCSSFVAAGRDDDLRHVLEAWYRLGNITYSTQPEERLRQEFDQFVEICAFAAHLPQRLLDKLAISPASKLPRTPLTQFENMTLTAIRFRRSTIRRIWRPAIPTVRRQIRRALDLVRQRRKVPFSLRHLVIRLLQRYDTFYDAYVHARLGRPLSSMHTPSLLKAAVYRLTLMLRGVKEPRINRDAPTRTRSQLLGQPSSLVGRSVLDRLAGRLLAFGTGCLNRGWLPTAEVAFRLYLARLSKATGTPTSDGDCLKSLLTLARAYLERRQLWQAGRIFDLCATFVDPYSDVDPRNEPSYALGLTHFNSGDLALADTAFCAHLVATRQTDILARRCTGDSPNARRYADFAQRFRRLLDTKQRDWKTGQILPPVHIDGLEKTYVDHSVNAQARLLFVLPQFIHNSDRYVECDLKDHLYDSAANAGIKADCFFADKIVYPIFERYPEAARADLAKLRDIIATKRPDVLVYAASFLGDEFSINLDYLSELKIAFNLKIVAFMEDAWNDQAVMYAKYWAPVADLIVHISPGCDLERENSLQQRVLCVPYPVNSRNFFPDSNKTCDVSFLGTAYAYLRPFWLTKALQAADELKLNHNIRSHQRSSDCPSMAEYGTILRRSRMVLNFSSREGRARPITGRAWQALHSGTVLLQEHSETIGHYFSPFIHYVPFDNALQLTHLMRFFASNPDCAQVIGYNAASFCAQHYSGSAVWARILNQLYSR